MCGMLRLWKLFYTFSAFQFIEKKAFERIIKESLWCSMKTYSFERTVLLIAHNNQSICVIFGAPHLAEPRVSDVRQNFGESCVSKKLVIASLSTLFYQGTLLLQLY